MLELYKKRLHRKPPPVMYPEGPNGRQVCSPNAAGRREYERRTKAVSDRQKGKCAICLLVGAKLRLDHQDGRGHGGGHRDDRILDEKGMWMNAGLCDFCNGCKGSKRYHWIEGKYQEVVRKKFKEIA